MNGGRHPYPEALYYHTAGDVLVRAKDETDSFKKKQLISTCMVFSALCLEAYINQAYYNFSEGRKIMADDDRLPLETKWLMFPLLMGAKQTFDKGKEPYQTFSALIRTRNNRLVHFRPSSERETTEKPLDKAFFSDLLEDVDLAEKYWKCVGGMIQELNTLTSGRAKLPNFLKGSRYSSEVWSSHRLD